MYVSLTFRGSRVSLPRRHGGDGGARHLAYAAIIRDNSAPQTAALLDFEGRVAKGRRLAMKPYALADADGNGNVRDAQERVDVVDIDLPELENVNG